MFAITRLVILTAFWKSAMCTEMTLSIRGENTSTNYYKAIVIKENNTELIMNNIFIGPSASFSIKYYGYADASTITFSQVKNGTFFKCWHEASIASVTCELQTMDQCTSTLKNKSCCSNRNAFLWNTTSEFLTSPEIKNITFNCDNNTHEQKLFVYERLKTSSSRNTPHMTLSFSTIPHMASTSVLRDEDHSNSTGHVIGIVVAVILVIVLVIVGFILWNRRKKQKITKNNTALNEERLENSESIRAHNVPNPCNIPTSVNMPVNDKNKFAAPLSANVDFKVPQKINATSSFSNDSEPQTHEGYCTGNDYNVPNSRHSTLYENHSTTYYEVPQLTDDYKTVDSRDLETAVNTTIGRTDDVAADYSTLVDTVEETQG